MSPADRARAASAERASVERAAGFFYVCDACGVVNVSAVVPEGAAWSCQNCQHGAAWEFPPERRANALAHAARIRRSAASGLFTAVTA
jgi:ribosomal protein L37AE/L43A